MQTDIILRTSELRPCYVKGEKALFHRWCEIKKLVAPSPMLGGHKGGEMAYTVAIVELDNGSIYEALPNEIVFADNKFAEFAFKPQGA